MSITSSNYQKLHPDFADLLTSHSGLTAWFFHILQNSETPGAEKLLSAFLAECASQGVAHSSYPFTSEDYGLRDLQIYLQNAQEEIDEFATLPTLHSANAEVQALSADIQVEPDVAEHSTLQMAAQPPALPEVRETVDANEGPTEKRPVVRERTDVRPGDTAHNLHTVPVEHVQPAPQMASVGTHALSRPGKTRTRRQRILVWVLLCVILGTFLIPVGFLLNFGISAYTTYNQLNNQAHSAINHLLAAKNIFYSGGKVHLSEILDPTKLRQAQADFVAASSDFQQLENQLKQSSTLNDIVSYFPQYRTTFTSALAASAIGADVANVGRIAASNAVQIAPAFSGSLLANSGKPLVTQPLLNEISATVDQILPALNNIQAWSHTISLDALPISAAEKAQIGQFLQILPQALNDLTIGRGLLGDASWLLGVDQPRTFLVQTMDRAELRGTGGFTGQYGQLQVSGGRIAPFSLTDISLLEYSPSSTNQGQLAPEQYRSWWPFANWGLRDSNISADFPTSAQLAISLYKQETGNQVDGLISFTPVVIEHILNIVGPIEVPGYNTTVTAQNLEDLLHYYQLDNTGITKQYFTNQTGNSSTSIRKRFTNYLSTLLMNKVRSAPPEELLAMVQSVFYDLKTKDLQIYFADPAAENVLTQYGYAGQLDRSTTHDGLYVVQENLSASKASQYVQTSMHDTVTLDAQRGATHVLQIRLVYNQAGPVYGYDTYYDYLRVYVPVTSQLLWGDGFASGIPLCGGAYGNCPVNGVYSGGELQCPAGQYQPGDSPPSLSGSSGANWQPLQTIGPPTNTSSDEPGRAMYGGWVIVPKNCTMTVSLSWYVPPMSQQSYALLVQRQAGTFPELDLSILPDSGDCARLETAGMHFNGTLTQDTSFTPPVSKPANQGNCYPRSGV